MASAAAFQRNEWFDNWFDSAHYQQLYGHRDQAEANAFVDALVDRLQPAGGARALDLGCGAGRHARRLAAHGLDVLGLDLAANSIAQAVASETDRLRFCRHDMRRPFGKSAFDYIFSFFTSLGYFSTSVEHLVVMSNIADALAACGTLVIDYLNAEHAESHLVPSEEKSIDGIVYRITRWTTQGHLFKRIAFDDAQRPVDVVERVAKFTLADFRRMLAAHGLAIANVFGDYGLGAYDPQRSPRLIIVARGSCGSGSPFRAIRRDTMPPSTAVPARQQTGRSS